MKRALAVAALVFLSCGKELYELMPFPCARDYSCPGQFLCIDKSLCEPWETCELVSANGTCSTAGLTRCTVLRAPEPPGGFTTICVAPQPSGQVEGANCPVPADGLYTGTDDCAVGTICYSEQSAGGGTESVAHCRKFCASDSDCGAAHHCAQAFAGPEFTNVARGVCEPICNPFGPICGEADHHCDALTAIGGGGDAATVCRSNGTAAQGDNCGTTNCQNGLVCIPGIAPFLTQPTCMMPCDGSHLCASGTCETNAFKMGSGLGFCH
jgi:hypothetical protein